MIRVVDDRQEAEEVVQETFLRAWRGMGRFEGRSQFFTWLHRIGVNKATRAHERRRGRPVPAMLDVMGLGEAAFKSRLHRARLAVRAAVEPYVTEERDP